MSHLPYPYEQTQTKQFVFLSVGIKRIEKMVEFTPIGKNNIVNLGFGDKRSDGTIDDKVNSNNGDIVKVLATVIEILRNYTSRFPTTVVHFEGSSEERNRLYCRIIRTYYSQFSKEFTVLAVAIRANKRKIVPFDPTINEEYSAFLIKRIV